MKNLFAPMHWLFTLSLYPFLILIFAISLFPGLLLIIWVWNESQSWLPWFRIFGLSISIITSIFICGVTLIAIVILLRLVFRFKFKEGTYPYLSYNVFVWSFYNCLILMVRFTIMDFIRATPLLPMFHRLMGAKVGKNVQINTKVIADSNLLEIGEGTVIGGDAQIICHTAEDGKLKIARTKIGKNVTIGILAVILPGTEIGDGATIGACTIVPKNSRIPAGTVWAGVPAREIKANLR